jgi:hypothetical protein
LCGDQLDSLKDNGHVTAILEQPIIIGTYPAAPVEVYEGYAQRDIECDNWSVTVHLFRLDQNNCCCVHESSSCHLETEVNPEHDWWDGSLPPHNDRPPWS